MTTSPATTPAAKQTDQQRLEQLVVGDYPCLTIGTPEEDYALQLIADTAMNLGRHLWVWDAVCGVHGGLLSDSPGVPDTENPAAALYHLSRLPDPSICVALDLAGHLSDPRTLRALRHLVKRMGEVGGTLILVDYQDQLPAAVRSDAMRFELSLPEEDELETLVREQLQRMSAVHQLKLQIDRKAFAAIIRNLRGLTRRQAQRIIADVVTEDYRLDAQDLNAILARKRQVLHTGGLLEFVEAPVDLDQIAGLGRLKAWLIQRRDCWSPQAQSFGLDWPRGVLMLGVPGSGKSLCAKAAATAWQRPLLRLDPSALYDKYIGESETRLREALMQAERMAPVILWVDEIEKGFASAAAHSVDGGLSQRMFGTLLTWMAEHTAPVFLFATANDIEALPPELLRKGRFDEIFFVDLPSELARQEIFRVHLTKRNRDAATFDLSALAAASQGYSGAEIEQAVVSALHDAFAAHCELSTELVVEAVKRSPPLSVTAAERVAALRRWSSGRCVTAD